MLAALGAAREDAMAALTQDDLAMLRRKQDIAGRVQPAMAQAATAVLEPAVSSAVLFVCNGDAAQSIAAFGHVVRVEESRGRAVLGWIK